MPALRAFGRRWNLGSDDLVYPGIIETAVRTMWLLALLVVYLMEQEALSTCQNGDWIQLFYLGTIIFLMIYFIINVSIATISARSYIMDPYPRRHVVWLLYIKLVVFVPECLWMIAGTYFTFGMEHNCKGYVVNIARTVVIIEWLVILTIMLSCYLMFDPLGKRHVKKRSLKDYHKFWRGRCHFLCCCMEDDNRNESFEEIAELLANFFRGRDFVLSDVLAGVVLLSIKQKYQSSHQEKIPLSEVPTLPIRAPASDRPPEINGRTHKYRMRSVEKPADITARSYRETSDGGVCNPCYLSDEGDADIEPKVIPLKKPAEDTKLVGSSSGKHLPMYGSSAQGDHRNIIKNSPHADRKPKSPRQGLRKQDSSASSYSTSSDDVFFNLTPPKGPKDWMTLENSAYYLRIATGIYGSSNYGGCYNCSDRIPLFKTLRCRKSDPHLPDTVIHGDNWWECETSSFMLYSGFDRDQIIFVSFDNQIYKTPYVVARDDAKKTVVVGIRGTMSAGDALTDLTAQGEWIREENIPRGNVHKGILKGARLIKQELEDTVQIGDKIPRGYGLVFTGHSLGAGIATILALLFRSKYPDVTCFAFSPPGGLVSHTLSVFMQDFVLTMFLGVDVVPRLGVITMEKLKSDLLVVIKNSRVPKHKILSAGFAACCCGAETSDLLIEDTTTERLTEMMYQEIKKDAHDTDSLSDVSMSDNVSLSSRGGIRAQESFCSSTFDQDSILSEIPEHRDNSSLSEQPLTMRSNSKVSQNSESPYMIREKRKGKRRQPSATGSILSQPVSESHSKWRNRQKKRKTGLAATEPLYLPGQILHLYVDEDLSSSGCCSVDTIYKVRWARAEEFNQVILDSRIMAQHNPYSIDEALQQILEQQGFSKSYVDMFVVNEQPKHFDNRLARPYLSETQDSIQEDNEFNMAYSECPKQDTGLTNEPMEVPIKQFEAQSVGHSNVQNSDPAWTDVVVDISDSESEKDSVSYDGNSNDSNELKQTRSENDNIIEADKITIVKLNEDMQEHEDRLHDESESYTSSSSSEESSDSTETACSNLVWVTETKPSAVVHLETIEETSRPIHERKQLQVTDLDSMEEYQITHPDNTTVSDSSSDNESTSEPSEEELGNSSDKDSVEVPGSLMLASSNTSETLNGEAAADPSVPTKANRFSSSSSSADCDSLESDINEEKISSNGSFEQDDTQKLIEESLREMEDVVNDHSFGSVGVPSITNDLVDVGDITDSSIDTSPRDSVPERNSKVSTTSSDRYSTALESLTSEDNSMCQELDDSTVSDGNEVDLLSFTESEQQSDSNLSFMVSSTNPFRSGILTQEPTPVVSVSDSSEDEEQGPGEVDDLDDRPDLL